MIRNSTRASGTPIERVLALFPGARRSGRDWMVSCPAHEDRTPSLAIAEADDGRVLLCCHGGCDNGSILKALGLTFADLYPDGHRRGRRRQQRPNWLRRPDGFTALACQAALDCEEDRGGR